MWHYRMRRPAYLTIIALLLLAAADAAGQAKLPGQGADACTVVSKAEIEQTLGVKLADGEKPPKLQTPGIVSTCSYKSSDGIITITIRRRPIKYQGTAALDAKKQGVEQGHVAGLGRDALLTEVSGVWNLSIFRGDYDFISVLMTGSSTVKPVSAALEKLGRTLLDRWK